MKKADLKNNEYSNYFNYYINLNSSEELLDCLKNQKEETFNFFINLPVNLHEYQYEIGKWTPKDILQHIIDSERIFAYRALCFSRKDNTHLPGYEENDYANNAFANKRTITDLLNEYIAVKESSIRLFSSLSNEMLTYIGVSNENNLSVRAIGFILTGHEIHHINIIKERYINKTV